MDIVTHAGIGLIAAAPFLASRPELAAGLVAGSVLPDLDALSRVFGRLAFLRSHQTWSHSLFVQAVISAVAGLVAEALNVDGVLLGAGLFAGFAGHTLLDLTNTLGVTLLAPFSRRRFCLEWVFFIDAFVLLATGIAGVGTWWTFQRNGEVSGIYATAFFLLVVVYVCVKGVLRRRAGLFAPDALSLVPSALLPWRFYGTAEAGASVRLFRVNAITGREAPAASYAILDDAYPGLQELPEFKLMRELSPAYHVISAVAGETGERITCRDLRTRNFGSTFGDLEVVVDANQKVRSARLHV